MTGIPTLTLQQPTPGLLIAGAQHWLTRPTGTDHRGRVLIHADETPVLADLDMIGPYFVGEHSLGEIPPTQHMDDPDIECGCGDWEDGDWDPACWAQVPSAPALLKDLGAHGVGFAAWLTTSAIVASAELVDCCPIVGVDEPLPESPSAHVIERTSDDRLIWWTYGDPIQPYPITHISDQLDYGDWSPGRWAWRLDDVQPVEARCPWCRGRGAVGRLIGPPCPVCGGAGHCDPIPARGKQGLWRWEPGT